MSTNEVKDQHNAWVVDLSAGDDTPLCELAYIIFDISFSGIRLEFLFAGDAHREELKVKKATCLSLLTSSLTSIGMWTLEELEGTPLSLVSLIPKVPFNCRCLPPSMVAPLVSAREYLGLRRVHPGLPDLMELTRLKIDMYLSSWSSAKQKGIITCYEKVSFDGNSEIWPGFLIELTGNLIKHGLRELLLWARAEASALPEQLFLQSEWLGRVLNIAVNDCPLRWPMHEGDKYGVALLLWLKIKY